MPQRARSLAVADAHVKGLIFPIFRKHREITFWMEMRWKKQKKKERKAVNEKVM